MFGKNFDSDFFRFDASGKRKNAEPKLTGRSAVSVRLSSGNYK